MEHEYIRLLNEIDEFNELQDLQKEVWGLEDRDIVPSYMFKSVTGLTGPNGIALGYFIENKIAGYLLTIPTSNPLEVLGCMLAVSKNYQHKGIGYKLNLKLREIMLSNNVEKVIWTFDPLESVNAHLYLRKLGGVITRYFVNYYGSVHSLVHEGLPTDRVKVEWNLNDIHVEERITNDVKSNSCHQAISAETLKKYVEIPLNMQNLKGNNLEEAMKWRTKTRKIFKNIIEKQKLIGCDFIVNLHKQKGMYIFR